MRIWESDMAAQTEILYKAMKIISSLESILSSSRETNPMKRIRRSKGVKATLLSGAVAMAAMAALSNGWRDGISYAAESQVPLASKDLMILKYSRIPSSVSIKAWTDPKFREKFIKNPNSVLYNLWGDSIKVNFIVHPDTEKIRNFCLPFPSEKFRSMTPKEIIDMLQREIGDSTSLDYFLPAPIMAQALIDDTFRGRLIRDPNTAIQEMGYTLQNSLCVIHVDTADTLNLTLKSSPNNASQLNDLDSKIVQSFTCGGGCHGGSSQCCATGTCDF